MSVDAWLQESQHLQHRRTPSAGLTAVRCLAGEWSLQEQLWLIVSLKMSSSGQCCRRVRLRGRDCTPTRQHVEPKVKLRTRPLSCFDKQGL